MRSAKVSNVSDETRDEDMRELAYTLFRALIFYAIARPNQLPNGDLYDFFSSTPFCLTFSHLQVFINSQKFAWYVLRRLLFRLH